MIDGVTGYRNPLDCFCKQRTWAARDIPDPRDDDSARYAFLACLPVLLRATFNERIKQDLVGDILIPRCGYDF